MSSAAGFTPAPAPGPFDPASHEFATSGTLVDPNVAWLDVWHPGLPALDPVGELVRARKAGLPLDPEEIGAACEALLGPPRPRDGRGYPGGADWVATTPKEGVYLIVRLAGDDTERFGYGIEAALMRGILDLKGARRTAALGGLREAVSATLGAIREQMEASPVPRP